MKWTIETDAMEVQVFPDTATLSHAAAQLFRRIAPITSGSGNKFVTVALAGGSTPKGLYGLLADENAPFRTAVDWGKISFFWGDERCVPPDSGESNFRMANENLLRPLGISTLNYNRMKGELEPAAAAAEYEGLLRSVFNLGEDDLPRFDLILLGMGTDGHTASLFPGTEALGETERIVAAPFVEKLGTHRLTLTPPVLNNASHVTFLVSGADKAEILRDVLEGEYDPQRLPSQIVRPTSGRLTWMVDEAAARLISPRSIDAKYGR